MPPRIVFMGSPAFAVPSLTVLAERPDIGTLVGVVTQPDKPAGRGQKLTACPVAVAAQARGLPLFQPTKMKVPETEAALRAWQPDVMIVAAYGRILPPNLLAIPQHGCINVHASLLPRWRGASPITHAILHGDAETGVDIMRMEEGLDTGPVYAETRLAIGPDDTTASLTVKLAELGAKLLAEVLPTILSGTLTAVPQGEVGVTYAGMLTKDHGALDFSEPAENLARRVRAMNPWPLAVVTTAKDAQRIQILDAVADPSRQGPPGEVLAATPQQGVLIGTGRGALSLRVVKPAGRPAMPVQAWLSGRGIAVGDRLTTVPKSPA